MRGRATEGGTSTDDDRTAARRPAHRGTARRRERPRTAGRRGRRGNGPAIISLILGIVGLIGLIFTGGLLGLLLGVIAIVLGVQGRRRVDSGRTTRNRGVATAGLVTGVLATVIGLLFLILVAIGVSILKDNPELQRQVEQQQQQR